MSPAWPWKGKRDRREADRPLIPPGVSVARQPVMTKSEAQFYNLLRLTVQDEYLVLSQVPIWCLVTLQSGDETARRELMGQIALKRVDFVLVHPGTLIVEKVIEFERRGNSPRQQHRDRLLEALFKQAGIPHVRISPHHLYTTRALATALGLEPME